ncbi:CAP domain-containing protein [Streptomyces sp. XM4193]|uniref:CAP domain-containing protein n=1 Tax=Streptomyces sp. XM4193 TaxID=2929782 RepID=UPI001FFB32D0|nr:CAP domain-containing protein [Streptomyces sp. XM4193]MCK1798818.1 CAP domain-containing protein [Streptomyces sp. XM4193]
MRTGLLGATGALALGAVAVASGMVPGVGSDFPFKDDEASTRVQADSAPDLELQGPPLERDDDSPASRDDKRSASPDPKASEDGDASENKDGKEKKANDRASDKPSSSPSTSPRSTPSSTPSPSPSTPDRTTPPSPTRPPSAPNNHSPVEAEVLNLVNQERAKAGCQPVTADTRLASLARDHSRDMDERDYFSHTDPDGNTPWDRAAARGITNLGAENIARGQADARAVMDSWMNSSGHRANILNCDYKTLGVGAHEAPGGPWWTQAFGF